MMAGNPNNWWSMMSNTSPLIPPQYVLGSSPSIIPFNPLTEIPEPSQSSWSQLLFTGVPGEEERLGFTTHFQSSKKLVENNNNWDDDHNNNIFINNNNNPSQARVLPNNIIDVIKHEVSQSGSSNNLLLYGHSHEEFQASLSSSNWSQNNNNNNNNNMVVVPVSSSPRSSSVTSLSSNNNNNLLDFSYNNNNKEDHNNRKNQLPLFATSEGNNNTTTTGVCNKKPRGQPSSSQPPLKVRKEKLGDRITALHQLVSPFGKTDTASVLLEAIGYIRFLQTQIEALSSPYLGNGSKSNMRNQHYVHGERNSVFPEDPGQLLNDTGLKRKVAPSQDAKDKPKDLRSRGLCLVPVSCTQHVGNENNIGADYWAPAYGGGF